MMKPMDMEKNPGTGYSLLLENPLMFLLFSDQAVAEFSMLRSHFGNWGRYMVMQICSSTASRINDARVISIERDNPTYDASYQQQLASAIRQTKLHKYSRSRDFTICAVLENEDDYNSAVEICERIYKDLNSAYCNHVYFDFYIMAKESFTPGASLELSSHIEALGIVAAKEWTRYIFLIFDITNEECLIENYSERFQAVLDSIVLTNCRSSAGTGSAYINECLLEETSVLGNKFLSLGRIKMTFNETMVRNVIRHELLERVQQLPSRTDIKLKQLNLNGLKHDIQKSIEGIYPGIKQIGFYKSDGKENIAQYTNHEVISYYFQNFADYYMQFHQEQLEKKFREYMSLYCQREIKSWLVDALHQSSMDIFRENCCEAIFQKAAEQIQKYREDIWRTSQVNENEYILWKNSKPEGNGWKNLFLKKDLSGYYEVLEEWIVFRGKMLAEAIFEQCLDDIVYYVRKWIHRTEEHYKIFSLCCSNARERLEEILVDCCSAERHLIQSYRQKVAQELDGAMFDIQHIRDILNGFLQEETDEGHMNRLIWQCVDWLYVQRLRKIELYCESDTDVFDEVLTKVQNHTYLFTRTQIPNIVPYVVLMGRSEDSFFNYARQRKDARYIMYEAEYMDYPIAFYYQPIR